MRFIGRALLALSLLAGSLPAFAQAPNVQFGGMVPNAASSGGGVPSGAAGGALKGTYPNPGLADISVIGTSLAIGAGSAITSSGPGGALDVLAYVVPGTGVATALGNTAGSAGGFALVGTTPPTGAAGGSLKGTYPNPGLADVNVIATSLAIGGATIGTNALAVTGTALFNSTISLQPGSTNVSAITFFGSTYGIGMDSNDLVLWGATTQGVNIKLNSVGGTSVGRFTTAGLTLGSGGITAGIATFSGQVTNALGTITTSKPLTLTQTWNAGGVAFTAFQFNITDTASGALSLLMDLQVGGASKFSVLKDGTIYSAVTPTANNYVVQTNGTSVFWNTPTASGTHGWSFGNGAVKMALLATGPNFRLSSDMIAGFSSGTSASGTSLDTNVTRASAGVWQLGTGTTANALGSLNLTNMTMGGQLNVTAMTQTSAAQSGTVCYNSGTGAVTYDATLGCLASTMRVKENWREIHPSEALAEVLRMRPGSYTYKTGMGLPFGEQVGLAAEQMANVDDRLVAYDNDGLVRGVRYQQASALYPAAIRALDERLKRLEAK